jgi:ABC-type phosphate transport system substrate-binding protein
MKTIQKTIVAIALVALMALSATSAVQGLTSSPQVIGRGSTTVQPVVTAASLSFPAYWNTLGKGYTMSAGDTVIYAGGSGAAFPGVYHETTPYADVGYMSRNPKVSEWSAPTHSNAQLWSIGAIDSVAIIKSTGNTWLKSQLTSQEVCDIYTNAAYVYCDDLPAGYLVGTAPHEPLVRVIRESTSGTFECFENYFLSPFGKTKLDIVYSTVEDSNPKIYTHMTTYTDRNFAIAFISLGYVETDPAVSKISIDFPGAPATYYAPTQANVVSGGYKAWRNLWTLTAGVPSSVTENMKISTFISYVRLPNPANPSYMGDYSDAPGASFAAQAGYIPTYRADFTGAQTLDDALNPYTTSSGQTQSIPDGVVGISDFFYFAAAYTQYNTNHQLNPYADMNADAAVNISDFFVFAANY